MTIRSRAIPEQWSKMTTENNKGIRVSEGLLETEGSRGNEQNMIVQPDYHIPAIKTPEQQLSLLLHEQATTRKQ